jgi:hypothetical protein
MRKGVTQNMKVMIENVTVMAVVIQKQLIMMMKACQMLFYPPYNPFHLPVLHLPQLLPRGNSNSTAADWKWDNVSNNPNTNATVLRHLGQNPIELDVTNEFMTTQFWEQETKETNLYASKWLAQT